MDLLVPIVIAVVLIALGGVAQHRGWIDLTGKVERGSGASLWAIDEVFAPTRHEAHQELERQTDLVAPAPTPGDPGSSTGDIYGGRITIRIDPH